MMPRADERKINASRPAVDRRIHTIIGELAPTGGARGTHGLRAEFNSRQFGPASIGGSAFQAAVKRLHARPFEHESETGAADGTWRAQHLRPQDATLNTHIERPKDSLRRVFLI